jgi:DNA-binding LacI/PurR family transcriptional regulator
MGFAPRVTAQRLVERRSRTLALHFPSAYASASSYDLDFLVGAADASTDDKHLFSLRTDELQPADFLNMFRSGLIDGAILMQVVASDWRIDLAREHDPLVVLIGRPLEEYDDVSWIDVDFEESIATIIDYLVSIGHESIGFLGRPARQERAGLGSAVRVRQGHLRALERHGLEDIHLSTDLDPFAAGQAAVNLVESHPEVTALVVSHGPSTVGVIRALESSGRRVP